MTGATFRITHQNPNYLEEAEEAFGIEDSDDGAYKEVFFGRESNTGRIYLGIKGNRTTQIAELDNIAEKVLLGFLGCRR